MPKASPIKFNFNAGEFAITVEGRVDLDRYPSSMRRMENCIAAPQGPCIRRSGTYYTGNAYDHTKLSGLVSFVFSDEQAQVLEFCDQRLRFMTEDGFQTYAPVSVTSVVTASPFKFTSAALGASVGDEVILQGFDPALNVDGRVTKITAKSGNDYTVDIPYGGATGAQVGVTVSRLYHIVTTYIDTDVRNIVAVQSIDVLYLFCNGYRPRTLSRYGAYDWRLAIMSFEDGPFEPEDFNAPTLTPNDRGWATGIHSSNTSASPDTGNISADSEATPAWQAFDGDINTSWSGNPQTSDITYSFATPTLIEGYTIYAQHNNFSNVSASPLDNAPASWRLIADGITLDEKVQYPSYKSFRTQYIKINNKVAATNYKLLVDGIGISGDAQRVTVAQIVFRKAGTVAITLTASSVTGINKDQGFLTTDVGRQIRLYQGDGFWRTVEITSRTSSTVVVTKLLGEPLYDLSPIRRWRFGSFSDTTGWPVTGAFFADRLVCGGVQSYPTLIAMSVVGAYTRFSPTDPDGTVVDDNGLAVKLNSRKASLIRWLVGDSRGLLIGTGDSEWILRQNTAAQAFSARNITADKMSSRGSAPMEPATVDRQVIFTQASRRTVREYAWNYEADGFKSPSMSLFAPHMGVPLFAQMAYAAEPHSIVWFRRDDGSLAGLTYQRDENVIGWHRHTLGGVVESMCVVPSVADKQDTLWMVIRRTINNQTVRYIERLMRFWDFDSTLESSHYVDCGLRLDSPTSNVVYGLTHLEGQSVCGLCDDRPFGIDEVVTVVNGSVTLPFQSDTIENYITVGLPFTSYAETNRIEAGAADGTAQGKVKRINNLVPFLWQSAYGEVGVHNEDQHVDEFEAIEYDREGTDVSEGVTLFDGMLGPMAMPPGYNTRGSLLFRQRYPLPFNIIALMPQMNTQDR